MSQFVNNTADESLLYDGVAVGLRGQEHVWGSFWINFAAVTADQTAISINDPTNNKFDGLYLYWNLTGGAAKSIQLYLDDTINTPLAVDCGTNAQDTADVWHRITWYTHVTSASTIDLFIYDGDGAADGSATDQTYAAVNGGLYLPGDDIRLGARIKFTATSLQPLNGLLEDVVICYGAAPTAEEITALQTQSARLALVSSSSTTHFYPDLLTRENFTCPYTGENGTFVSRPARRIGPSTMDYGFNASMAVIGDTQFLENDGDGSEYLALGTFVSTYFSKLNCKAALHVGDWVDSKTSGATRDAAFEYANAAVDLWIASIPTTFGVGNHDIVSGGTSRSDPEMMESGHLPTSLFTVQSWHYEQMGTSGEDHYAHAFFVDCGGNTPELIISLPFGPTPDQWAWAQGLAAQFSSSNVWIVTHSWLNAAGNQFDDSDTGVGEEDQYHTANYFQVAFTPPPVDSGGTVANSGEDGDWYLYARHIPNLVGIICGHDIFESETAQQTPVEGFHGNNVLQMYVNAQDVNLTGAAGNGREGYMQFIVFEDDGSVRLWSYNAITDFVGEGDQDEATLSPSPALLAQSSGNMGIGSGIGVSL